MNRSYFDASRPIAALATPEGESALAVIRSSGPGAVELAAALFSRPAALISAQSMSLVHGQIVDPADGQSVDEVLAAVFRAPDGPVGEDGVEFYCHGSPAVVRKALLLLESAGFAPALRGEFTFRAFLNGKTDLVKAEAIQELVRAGSEGARAEARRRQEGGLSGLLAASRKAILDLLASVEARLDYAEDDDSPAGGLDPASLRATRDLIAGLAASHAAGRLYERGARAVVAGRPNAGKSSLFNLLAREERSIVAAAPGTTRDWIETGIELERLPVRLIDTAGLRFAENEVEAEGVARSRRLVEESEAVVYVVDGCLGLSPSDTSFLETRPDALRVWNKIDEPSCAPAPLGFLSLSARTGSGLRELVTALHGRIAPRFGLGEPSVPGSEGGAAAIASAITIASGRQKLLLDKTVASLDACIAALEAGSALDALSLDLREAADSLGEITGEIASEEILTAVFSQFCLGK